MSSSKEILSACCDKTTAHGILYVVNGTTIPQRLFWLLIFLGASAAFAVTVQQNVAKYWSEPTSVSINTHGTEFPPPDIYFCNSRPLAKSRLLQTVNTSNTRWLRESVANLTKVAFAANSAQVADYTQLARGDPHVYFWSSLPTPRLYETASHVNFQTVYFLNNSNTVHQPAFFTCFRYRPNNVTRELKSTGTPLRYDIFLDQEYSTSMTENVVQITTFSGASYGQDNRVFTGPASDFEYFSPTIEVIPSGLSILFAPQDTYPHIDTPQIIINPGTTVKIFLRMEQSVSANTKRDPCQEDATYVEYYNPLLGGNATMRFKKTFTDCKYAKILKKMWDEKPECQCVPYFSPVTLETRLKYPTCVNLTDAMGRNASELERVKNQTWCFKYLFEYDASFDPKDCKEENPCTTITYQPVSTVMPWGDEQNGMSYSKLFAYVNGGTAGVPTAPKEWVPYLQGMESLITDYTAHDNNLNITLKNLAKVELWAAESRSTVITESTNYEFGNLISDIGGSSGLYIGTSFLSILEFFNLFHDLIILAWTRRKNKVQTEKEPNGNVIMEDDDSPKPLHVIVAQP